MIIKVIEKTHKTHPLKGGSFDWKLSTKYQKKHNVENFMSFSQELKKQNPSETKQTLLFTNEK